MNEINENKTTRKNKTNLTINWPANTEYFTMDSLQSLNPNFINITLRVRLTKAVAEEKIVAVIGTKNYGKGRPKLIMAMRPVLPCVLDKAKNDGVFIENETSLIPVMDVSYVPPTQIVNPVASQNVEA